MKRLETKRQWRSPDWVLVGVNIGPGVVQVWASKDLNKAEIEAVATLKDFARLPGDGPWRSRDAVYVLSTEMGSIEVVQAETYADALRNLMRRWNPDEERLERMAIAPPSRAIEPY